MSGQTVMAVHQYGLVHHTYSFLVYTNLILLYISIGLFYTIPVVLKSTTSLVDKRSSLVDPVRILYKLIKTFITSNCVDYSSHREAIELTSWVVTGLDCICRNNTASLIKHSLNTFYLLTLCDKAVCQWLVTVRGFSPGTPASSLHQ
jgi:hypothetical protein